ncbi:peptide-methionine (R)-S-oxide reductase [Salinimicrobium catena]|uniref:peptide-methionine (R)-S-oxide reductase n=1 Tax=Salinimicrobium catena TaxID=390640 RepID=A0A1H5NVM5_9FLAO|nr:peptide-methionine (R)-S-oxide reductase MsrB [Salinimicrobium catena]SDL59598.1 peptide-methionine (R)-S-oxide reductase [Salinimicrobium catena]SEF05743.1 peptide-methionine (R)-S-oxide reductase [Salinimicrobium catena]
MKNYLLLILLVLAVSCNGNAQRDQEEKYPLTKSEAEWKAELSPQEFQVLRKKGTEPAFSSELNDIEEPGTFVCAACGNALYRTENKFDSGTGWPSFDRPIDEDSVDYRPDKINGYSATEVVCANCGGHLGHVFNDGPKETTGKRHCINGVAMDFIPDNE